MLEINKTSKKKKFKYVRKYNDNCHIGQKKLLFSEIYFLTIVSKYVNINDCILVYVGASPGSHINILNKLFPNLYFVLYDINIISMDFTNNLTIFDKKEGFFNDSKIDYLLKLKKRLFSE